MPMPLPATPDPSPIGPKPRRFARRSNIPAPPNWQTPPPLRPAMDQGDLNTCTAFALCATISDLKQIQSKGKIRIDLSPGHLHWCLAGLAGADSLDVRTALDLTKNNKVALVTPNDYPYNPAKCSAANGYLGIRSYSTVYTRDDAKAALQSGPIIATMFLYANFKDYVDGIYRPQPGVPIIGNHTVELVGYNDEAHYWIIKNSAGPDWGNGGLAYIAYGTCGLFTENSFWAFNVTI